ncbi:DUF4111 domain-containing protein [Brevibacillus sp. B_LB10_24]|uniref:DUF4111 domain-containing protein n=1 Tax=Brevibacillus sp. B_LB10_24 TaxID=3380645 RepID=UPI0038B8F3FD
MEYLLPFYERFCVYDIGKNQGNYKRRLYWFLHSWFVGDGGFNPKSSDIDAIVVTKSPVTVDDKREFALFFLEISSKPFPVEISFLNEEQLKNWQHPCPFDFHYSEFWRERYEMDLCKGANQYLNDDQLKDPDLAAHVTVLYHRGICVEGRPVHDVFPSVPRSDYMSAIMGDFEECLENMNQNPVYCTLNAIRVYWYLKEGMISSKREAGNWGLASLPKEMHGTIQKALKGYADRQEAVVFEVNELLSLRDYVKTKMQELFCSRSESLPSKNSKTSPWYALLRGVVSWRNGAPVRPKACVPGQA